MNEPLQAFERDKVIKIISSVITKVGAQETISREALYKELRDLHDIIEAARKEIGFAAPADIKDTHIPTATDELDEVVNETAKATGEIMDCCDIIQNATAGTLTHAEAEAINAAVMRIYEACSFQDITGQRVRKVIKTLKEIDAKVDALLKIIGIKASGKAEEKKVTVEDEKSLLNGPQLPGGGVSQADIDKILSEFG